jgi:hypothetical protein
MANADAAREKSAQVQRYLSDEESRRQAEQDKANEMFQEYQKTKDEYKSMSVDSGRLWNNKSTGDKIMTGFAVILGGLGGTLARDGTNVGLDLVEKAIDRDIDEQKANIAKKGTDVAESRGMYSDLLQKFGNERAARLGTQEMILSKLQSDAQVIAEQRQGTLAGTMAAARAADIGVKRAEKQAELTKVMTADVTKTAPITKNDPKPLPPEKILDLTKKEASYDRLKKVRDAIASGSVETGLGLEWRARLADAAGLKGNVGERVLRATMQQNVFDDMVAIGGSTVSAKLEDKIKSTVATFDKDPTYAVALIDEQLAKAEKDMAADRRALGTSYTVPPTTSEALKAKSHSIK